MTRAEEPHQDPGVAETVRTGSMEVIVVSIGPNREKRTSLGFYESIRLERQRVIAQDADGSTVTLGAISPSKRALMLFEHVAATHEAERGPWQCMVIMDPMGHVVSRWDFRREECIQ